MPLFLQTTIIWVVFSIPIAISFADVENTHKQEKGPPKQLIKAPKESPPRFPNVINPLLQTFDIESITIPDSFNYDVASIIVDANAQLYLALNPYIVEQVIPLSYGSKTFEFTDNNDEHWYVFYIEGQGAIDIAIQSALDVEFDVLNQEGSSVPLSENGRINAIEFSPGFYYLRVINSGALGADNSYKLSLISYLQSGQGGEIHGTISSACDDEPVPGASVAIETDFRFTHKDGSFEFLPKNAGTHEVTAMAQGFESLQIQAEIFTFQTTLVDLKLQPVGGCANPGLNGSQQGLTPRFGPYLTPVVFNEFTGITDFNDVLATGLPGGDKHFRVQLKQIEGQVPVMLELTEVREIKTQNQNVSALYDYQNSSLSIPVVQALGRLYSVKLTHTADFTFSIVSITDISQ